MCDTSIACVSGGGGVYPREGLLFVVVGVLTLTRIITKSVVTGQAPVTLDVGRWGIPRRRRVKTQTNQRWYTHIMTADAIHASARNIKMWNRESAYDVAGPYWLVHTSHYLRLPEKPTIIPLAAQERLPRARYLYIYITGINSTYHDAYARQTQVNWKKKTKRRKEKKRKERKRKKRREQKRKRKTRKGKLGKLRKRQKKTTTQQQQEEETKQGKEKREKTLKY